MVRLEISLLENITVLMGALIKIPTHPLQIQPVYDSCHMLIYHPERTILIRHHVPPRFISFSLPICWCVFNIDFPMRREARLVTSWSLFESTFASTDISCPEVSSLSTSFLKLSICLQPYQTCA